MSDCTLSYFEKKFATALLRETGTEVSPAIDGRIRSTLLAAVADRRMTNTHGLGFTRAWRFPKIRTDPSHDDREGVSDRVGRASRIVGEDGAHRD